MLLGRRVGAQQAGAYVLCNLAYLARLAGDLDEAAKLLDEAASMFGALGDRYGEALVCSHVGCLHGVRGEHDAGRAALERSLQLRQGLGDRRAIGLTLCNQGVLTASEGDVERGIVLAAARAGRFPGDRRRAWPGRVHPDDGQRLRRCRCFRRGAPASARSAAGVAAYPGEPSGHGLGLRHAQRRLPSTRAARRGRPGAGRGARAVRDPGRGRRHRARPRPPCRRCKVAAKRMQSPAS